MSRLNTLDWVALVLLVIGGLNWGLVAFGWNLVDALFGVGSMLSTVVYGLVGLSAVYVAFILKRLNS